jgi:hypothetical protein
MPDTAPIVNEVTDLHRLWDDGAEFASYTA